MKTDISAENIKRLEEGEFFQFKCHHGVSCFTECCRELELSLTPYDTLRLRKRLKLTSAQFLDQYVIIEEEEGKLPQLYLGMVDDGRASCPFVKEDGCTVYSDRPAPCRTYPLARGAYQTPDGKSNAIHMVISEPHCQGFSEPEKQDIHQWNESQGLGPYNEINDLMIKLLHHRKGCKPFVFSKEQSRIFLIALYDLERFKSLLDKKALPYNEELSDDLKKQIADDDIALLKYAISWLKNYFSEK
jgi:uncharacterized protein